MSDEAESDEVQEQINNRAVRIRNVLLSSLGANGMVLGDNDVALLIQLIDDFLEQQEEP